MSKPVVLVVCQTSFISLTARAQYPAARPAPLPATVIMPASDFLQEIPKGDIVADADTLHVPWILNTTGLREEQVQPYQLPADVQLLRQYQIPGRLGAGTKPGAGIFPWRP